MLDDHHTKYKIILKLFIITKIFFNKIQMKKYILLQFNI